MWGGGGADGAGTEPGRAVDAARWLFGSFDPHWVSSSMWRFLILRGGSLLRGRLAMPGDTVDGHTGGWGATICKDQRPGVLLNLLQYTGQGWQQRLISPESQQQHGAEKP